MTARRPGSRVTFTQARTGKVETGVLVAVHVQTGELLIERDNGSREYVKPGSVR